MITVAVLGVVEARRDGVRLEVPAGKPTELLARLALDVGVLVPADVLVEDLWAAPTGRNTLQSKVSGLRRALADRSLVRETAGGYVLAVPPETVDAHRVVGLAEASAAARSARD